MATQPNNKAGIQVVQMQPRGALRPPEGGASPRDFHAQVRSVHVETLQGALGQGGSLEKSSEGGHGGPASGQS